jgi:hypothetical protein
MKRLGTLVVLILSAVLASAVAAHAKGITEAKFTGPGLPPGGITFKTDAPGPGSAISHELMSGLGGGIFDAFRLDAAPVPKSELGPRYEVTLAFDFAPLPIRATLYPYAEGAPAVFIPVGQKLGPEFEVPTLAGGWTTTDAIVLDTLIDLGFPKTAPDAETTPAPNVPPPAEPQLAPSSSWWAEWTIVGGVLLVLLTVLIVFTFRRPPRLGTLMSFSRPRDPASR